MKSCNVEREVWDALQRAIQYVHGMVNEEDVAPVYSLHGITPSPLIGHD